MTVLDLTPADVAHRKSFHDYVVNEAEESHRLVLADLYEAWGQYHRDFFHDMTVPYIVFGTPGSAKVLGQCANISDWGGKLQITLRRSLFDGTYKGINWDAPQEGIDRYRRDVLLHEMVHQFHFEVTGDVEASYKGHGPKFAEVCNTIGKDLGLDPVRPAKARGKDKEKPSCAQWPLNVRPKEYYMGAVVEAVAQAEAEAAEDEPTQTQSVLSDEELEALMTVVGNYYELTQDAVPMNALGKLLEALGVGN